MGKHMPGERPVRDLSIEVALLRDLEAAADTLDRTITRVENGLSFNRLNQPALEHLMSLCQARAATRSYLAYLSREVLARRLEGESTIHEQEHQ